MCAKIGIPSNDLDVVSRGTKGTPPPPHTHTHHSQRHSMQGSQCRFYDVTHADIAGLFFTFCRGVGQAKILSAVQGVVDKTVYLDRAGQPMPLAIWFARVGLIHIHTLLQTKSVAAVAACTAIACSIICAQTRATRVAPA